MKRWTYTFRDKTNKMIARQAYTVEALTQAEADVLFSKDRPNAMAITRYAGVEIPPQRRGKRVLQNDGPPLPKRFSVVPSIEPTYWYLVQSQGSWGKGVSLRAALQALKRAGGKSVEMTRDPIAVYEVSPDVYIDAQGHTVYPNGAKVDHVKHLVTIGSRN